MAPAARSARPRRCAGGLLATAAAAAVSLVIAEATARTAAFASNRGARQELQSRPGRARAPRAGRRARPGAYSNFDDEGDPLDLPGVDQIPLEKAKDLTYSANGDVIGATSAGDLAQGDYNPVKGFLPEWADGAVGAFLLAFPVLVLVSWIAFTYQSYAFAKEKTEEDDKRKIRRAISLSGKEQLELQDLEAGKKPEELQQDVGGKRRKKSAFEEALDLQRGKGAMPKKTTRLEN